MASKPDSRWFAAMAASVLLLILILAAVPGSVAADDARVPVPTRKPADVPESGAATGAANERMCWRFDSAELTSDVIRRWNGVALERFQAEDGPQFDLMEVNNRPLSFMRGNARTSACFIADTGKVRCERGPEDYRYKSHKIQRAHAMIYPVVGHGVGPEAEACAFGRGIFVPLERTFRYGYEVCVPEDAGTWLPRTNWVLISQMQHRSNPNAAIHIKGGPRGSYFYACVRGDAVDHNKSGRDFDRCVKPIGPPVRPGRCYTIEEEYLGSQRGGYRVWIDGAKVFDSWQRFRGPVPTVYGVQRPYITIGMYTYDNVFETRKGALYFDKIWIKALPGNGS